MQHLLDLFAAYGLPTATALDMRLPARRPLAPVEALQATGVAPD